MTFLSEQKDKAYTSYYVDEMTINKIVTETVKATVEEIKRAERLGGWGVRTCDDLLKECDEFIEKAKAGN